MHFRVTSDFVCETCVDSYTEVMRYGMPTSEYMKIHETTQKDMKMNKNIEDYTTSEQHRISNIIKSHVTPRNSMEVNELASKVMECNVNAEHFEWVLNGMLDKHEISCNGMKIHRTHKNKGYALK